MLTPRLKVVLDFIVTYMRREGGVSPTLEEIATGVGLKSRGRMGQILTALEERGFIRRMHRKSRAIQVLRCSDGASLSRPPAPGPQDRDVVLPTLGKAPDALKRVYMQGLRIP